MYVVCLAASFLKTARQQFPRIDHQTAAAVPLSAQAGFPASLSNRLQNFITAKKPCC
jgi:hypothetical protein